MLKRYPQLIFLILLLGLATNAFGAITFSPRLTVSEEYTDNVERTRENREEDFIFRVTPGATLNFTGRSSNLSLRYDPTYSQYHINTELSRWSHAAGLDAFSQFTRNTRGFLRDTFIYSEDPALDTTDVGRTGRNPFARNVAVAGFTNQFGERNTATLQYTHTEYREWTDGPDDDGTTYSPQFLLAYWFSSQWGFDTELRYTRGEFEITENFDNTYANLRLLYGYSRRTTWFVRYAHTVMTYAEDSDDYQIYYPSLGFEYTYDDTTFLSVEGGPLIRKYEDETEEYGAVFLVEGRKTWPYRRGNVNLFVRNGLDYDYASADNLGLYYYTQAGGSVDYGFTRNLQGNVNAAYRYNAYVDVSPERYDNVYQAGTGLNYLMTSWCRVNLNYTFFKRESTDTIQEYYENRVYLGVTFSPRNPYVLRK